MTHKHLLKVMKTLPEDYTPWGNVEFEESDCSCGCKWYAPLAGKFELDWGICGNPKSHRCGLLTFEHQGCVHYAS